jgi:hypothetical protein
MHYIICPIRPDGTPIDDNELVVTEKVAKKCLKNYFTNLDRAKAAAEQLAKDNPAVQFAVFKPVAIFETQKPAAPPVIRKKLNDQGEIVLDKGD